MTDTSPLITAAELGQLEGSSLTLFDCRFSLADPSAGRRAYETAHVPGAVYVDLERDLSAPVIAGSTGRHPLPAPADFARRLGQWGVSREGRVVAYDDAGGAIAARLWWMLRWLGHDAVSVLDGGWPAWLAHGGATDAEAAKLTPRHFEPELRSHLVVSAAELQEIAHRDGWRVFDARARDRYTGEHEPIDPVAGHIPGARSLPFADNLHQGAFLEPALLRRRFDAACGDVPPERCVVYCGSGVTACHDVLAAAQSGRDGMRLYAGSWSEWITDPARPVARGDG